MKIIIASLLIGLVGCAQIPNMTQSPDGYAVSKGLDGRVATNGQASSFDLIKPLNGSSGVNFSNTGNGTQVISIGDKLIPYLSDVIDKAKRIPASQPVETNTNSLFK